MNFLPANKLFFLCAVAAPILVNVEVVKENGSTVFHFRHCEDTPENFLRVVITKMTGQDFYLLHYTLKNAGRVIASAASSEIPAHKVSEVVTALANDMLQIWEGATSE